MPTGLFSPILLLMIINLSCIDGEDSLCLDRSYSSLCFCRSNSRSSAGNDFFLAEVSLTQCSPFYAIRQCRQARFSPSSTDVNQLVPSLVNLRHCYNDSRCLHSLSNSQRCHRCQMIVSTMETENVSRVISTTNDQLPTDSCFYLCEHQTSCGFLCFDRRVTVDIHCNSCRGRRKNVTCRCVRERASRSCAQSLIDTSTERWMQKRGFPAAGILALLVLITIFSVLIGKLINRRLRLIANRKSSAVRRSIGTITTYRSRQASPSTAISFPTTPLLPPTNSRKDIVPINTMVELLNSKSPQYVVDIHREDDEDELSVFLLEKTTETNPKQAIMPDIDDDDDDDDDEEEEDKDS